MGGTIITALLFNRGSRPNTGTVVLCQFSDRSNKAKSGSQIPEGIETSICDVWESGCSAWDFTLELTVETDSVFKWSSFRR